MKAIISPLSCSFPVTFFLVQVTTNINTLGEFFYPYMKINFGSVTNVISNHDFEGRACLGY